MPRYIIDILHFDCAHDGRSKDDLKDTVRRHQRCAGQPEGCAALRSETTMSPTPLWVERIADGLPLQPQSAPQYVAIIYTCDTLTDKVCARGPVCQARRVLQEELATRPAGTPPGPAGRGLRRGVELMGAGQCELRRGGARAWLTRTLRQGEVLARPCWMRARWRREYGGASHGELRCGPTRGRSLAFINTVLQSEHSNCFASA